MKKRIANKGLMRMMLSLLITGAALTSCNTIYDDTDDCRTELRVKFTYDYNMKFADAFSHEVKTVHLYAFDESGKLVFEKTDEGATVGADGYTMNVDELKTGRKYDFIVWAEGENRGDSYDFAKGTTKAELTAKLKRESKDGLNLVSNDLTPLFHGSVEGGSFQAKYGTTQTITVPLVKDTKNVKVVLQELNGGEKVNPDDFTLTITDDNGFLNYDNSLLSDATLTYSPWSVTTGMAGVDEGDTKVGALVAEFSVNRLVKEGHNPRLTVTNKQGEKVLSIPLIDYFLLVKGNYNKGMSDQEFLDRQDTYDMTFFIDNGFWVSSYIYINSWRVVPPQNEDIK